MFSEFIWNSRTGKISRKQAAQDYADGGLKLTHVGSFMKALKIKWIKKVISGKEDWIAFLKNAVGENLYDTVWQLDKKSLKMLAHDIENDFWKEVLESWADLTEEPVETGDILRVPLWNSYFIRNTNVLRWLAGYGCSYET